ncbi:MAG: phospho-sugar mutase, partial [Cellulophaga sp.]|nr:phospho-sugar mutase [Cellulophaga sp.]
EIAADAKAKGSSFYKDLIDCYVAYGFYKEKLISLTKKGMDGAAEIKQMMIDFKENPVVAIDGSKVIIVDDYNTSTSKNIKTGEITKIDIPTSNVLIYTTEDGTRMAARPSGTEPKIKFYFSINSTLDKAENYKKVNATLEAKIERILSELKLN